MNFVEEKTPSGKVIKILLDKWQFMAFDRKGKSIVNEEAGEVITNSSVNEHGSHGRINSTRQSADDLAVLHLLTDPFDTLTDELGRRPVPAASTHFVGKVLDELPSLGRVSYLWMKLKTEYVIPVSNNGEGRILSIGKCAETLRQLAYDVAMTHPHRAGRG